MTHRKAGDAQQDTEQGAWFAREGNTATIPVADLKRQPADTEPQELELPDDFSSEEMRVIVGTIEAYCQRKGHVPIGTVMQLADALGLRVMGSLALVDANEPQLVLFPNLTARACRLFLHLAESDTTHWHPISERDYRDIDPLGLYPAFEAADPLAWNRDQPQAQANQWYWLPLVLCAERSGDTQFRQVEVNVQLTEVLGPAFARIISRLLGAEPDEDTSYANGDRATGKGFQA